MPCGFGLHQFRNCYSRDLHLTAPHGTPVIHPRPQGATEHSRKHRIAVREAFSSGCTGETWRSCRETAEAGSSLRLASADDFEAFPEEVAGGAVAGLAWDSSDSIAHGC